ncbi:hypothetical protein MMC12_008469 [Toensbergia leucococca]|nr:hypothetical protein [Toensbergia leucococca]
MSSPMTPRTASATSANTPDKARLTEQEKKNNHISSEQKRRAAIRDGFDRLAELVPGLQGQGRSEGMVLTKVVEYAKKQLEERETLIKRLEAKGGVVEGQPRR